MATSHYRNYLDSVVDNYVGRLITSVAQIDDSSENFEIAERFVKSNILYHRYLDTNKNEVQRNLQGVIEKLMIHSQSEKAERIEFLIKRFLTKPLKQDVLDIHYVVLSMLLHLSTNPLESVYYPTKFHPKVDDQEALINDLRRELNIEDEVNEEWGYSEEESIDEDQEDEEEFEEENESKLQKKKGDNKQPLKLTTLREVAGTPRELKDKLQPEADRTFPNIHPDNMNLSMIDKSLVLGTLPMQPYSAFSGLGVFRLPLGEVQKQSNIPQHQDQSFNLKSLTKQEQPSFLFPTQQTRQFQPPQLPQIVPSQRFEQQQAQRSAKKRKFTQLNESPEKPTETRTEVNRYEEDKNFIERTFLQTDLWKNPNSLNTILQEYYMKPDSKGRPRSEFSGINHWFFTMTTERALIQDILLMLNGIENESFKINEFHQFERRNPLQLKHVSPEALKNTIDKFILLANTTLEVGSNMKLLSENYNTTVMEGFTECVREFGREYKSYIEDVQCIFMKEASQVKPKDLGVRHPTLQEYVDKRTITLMELLPIFGSYIKNFGLICETCRHLIETFNNAASDIEQVVRGDTQLTNFKEIKPFISMIVLSYLHRIFSEAILGANDNSTNGLIIRLFFKSWEPYLDILDKWLKHGTLMDKYSEFFIKYDKNSNVITNFYAKLNWNEDYVFQTYTVKWKLLSEERTFICVPNFLAKQADTVSRIGKTIKVLGYLIHQENLFLYLDKFDFKEQFFANLLSRMREDEAYAETFMNEEIATPSLEKTPESAERIKIKDYTFGAKLRSQPKTKEKQDIEKDQNILYDSLPKKLDAYMNNFELAKFSIKAFTINTPLPSSTQDTKQSHSLQNGLAHKDKERKQKPENTQDVATKVSSAVLFYEKVKKTKNQENLNSLKIHLDYEIEHLLISMDSDFSLQLTDLLFDHFHLMEHLRILRMVFFLQKEPIYENFLQEVLLKIRSTLLENNLVKLNQLLKDALGKIGSHQVRNISSLFSIENESKDEPAYNFSIMNNYAVIFKPTYPLDIIFDGEIMKLYNRIFKFILQIKRAKFALTSNNVSIKKPLKTHDGKPKKTESRDITIDYMEEEDASPWNKKPVLDKTIKIKEINSLKRSFGLGQTELLHFVNNLEFFVGYSVIEEHTKEYEKHIKESSKITEIRQTLKEYLEKIAEICQLHNKKNDMLFELLKSTLNLCWDFHNLYNRFEERFTFMSNTDGSLTKIRNELELIMKNFRDNNKMVLQILHQYHQKGHKLYIKSLFSNLNFNYFYLSETGDYIQ